MNKDLTVGNPESVLWKFCLPLFGSIVFQQLYNIADSLVAGKFIGENALAAVGNSYEITLIFIAFAFGCNMGCSVIVSQYFGAKKYGKMKTAVSTACIASVVLCVALMAGGILGCGALLHLINTPAEVFADSQLYLDIYIWSLPFVFFYNIATGIFSALGDSKTPFIFLAISSTANIGMDILFVTAFKMGVAGVAWATFLCQGVSCVLAVLVVFLRLKKVESGTGKAPLFSWPIFKKIVVIAVPSILQQGSISVGNIIIQSVINGFGPGVMAGYSAAVKLNNLVITSFTTLGNGIQLHRPEHGCPQAGPHQTGFPRRRQDGMDAQRPAAGAVLLCRAGAFAAVPERSFGGCDEYRHHLPAHSVALLLHRFRQVGGGRHFARCGPDGPLYDRHLHRPDPARCAGAGAVQDGAGFHRHLVRLARGLDGGRRYVLQLLPQRSVESRADC